jgi:soluble lytic murein transglycosylase-like protein
MPRLSASSPIHSPHGRPQRLPPDPRRRGPGGRAGLVDLLARHFGPWILAALLLPALGHPPRAATAGTASGTAGFARPPAPWHDAATAVRLGDAAAARRLLEPLTSGDTATAREARLVLGLLALAEQEFERGADLLRAAAEADGRFEDWRLLGLADCHAALGRLPAAAATLARLLDNRPGSPLRSTAALRAAAVAAQLGNGERIEELIALGRREQFGPEAARQLEEAAWRIALDSGDEVLQRAVARRLLVQLPILASRLQVIELFRQPSGALDWLSFLSVEELFQRARSLLAAGIAAGALDALDAVPARSRGLDWKLLRVEALTLAQRSDEARALVATLEAETTGERIRIERLRAAALIEAARVRPGRAVPSAAERQRLRAAGRDALWRVLELADDHPAHREAALTCHRRLLALLLDEEQVEPAMALLPSLRRLDPEDETGARFLWQFGWREYQRRNPTGAIGYWSELEVVYPDSRFARSGRYWTARAYEALGERQRAEAIFREVASAGAEDFYRRHARLRLAGGAAAGGVSAAQQPREPWPWDARLARALWLSDRGLGEAALIELRGLSGQVEGRAADALEAVVLSRLGRRRDAIHAISRAFPQLGTLQQASAPAAAAQIYYPTAFEPIVRRFAGSHRIPAALLFAIIRQESAFDPAAVSRSGARGLMQLMPATGRELAQRMRLRFSDGRLADPEFNIRLGSSYFRQLLEMFDGNEELALAGYNGGPYRIKRLWRDEGSAAELDLFLEGLELAETTRYVKRIVLFRHTYGRLDSGSV